ncbi:MAG: anthranilate synthase component I [Candidatus Omnitrophica bacterium]|nr:anthranilate synthase component I [Candidatus Omnitrophota bacterium]
MIKPSLKEFLKLCKKGNVIPVYNQINADLDTPVSAFLKIAKSDDYAFLLESVEGREKTARYSFLGANPALIFRSKARDIQIIYPHAKSVKRFTTGTDPLDEIRNLMKDFKAAPCAGLPRFYGGLVGYIGYDTVRFFEEIPDKNPDELNVPDCVFILTDTILIFDHVNHTIKIVANVMLPEKAGKLSLKQKIRVYDAAVKKIEAIQEQFGRQAAQEARKVKSTGIKISSNFTRRSFCDIVTRAKEYIRKGDIIQVVLSQRFKIKISHEPFSIYRNLRSLNPSPYMFFLKLKEISLVGTSPEMLVRCEDGTVQTRPIAGTRPRGKTEAEDEVLEKELLNDAKERAEHIMLVDLGRNDLGRIARSGQVTLSEFMTVEKYSHVMHLVTEVKAKLDKKYDIYGVLRACFPAGTVSGSPKIRAMEIIDELEISKRGPYAGCVGYFSFSHNMDTCITIRTILVKDKTAYIQAGGGIVADSIPIREYNESVNKARALIEAIRGGCP